MNVLSIGRGSLGMASLCLLIACGSASTSQEDSAYINEDKVEYAYNSDTMELPKERLMIRKADMEFKVKELQKASQKIATITKQYGGEIWDSRLESEIQNTISKPISNDSLLEVTLYRQTNTLLLRVLSNQLDSLLDAFEALSLLLNKKVMTTDNVSLAYLSNELKAKNRIRTVNRHEEKLDKKKSNLEQYTASEFLNTEMQNDVIDKQIENLAMLDKVNYSTVTLSIYQDVEAYKNIVANYNSNRFEAGFGASCLMALQDGKEMLVGLILFLIQIWPVYFVGIGLFFLIRYIDRFRPKVVLEKKG